MIKHSLEIKRKNISWKPIVYLHEFEIEVYNIEYAI